MVRLVASRRSLLLAAAATLAASHAFAQPQAQAQGAAPLEIKHPPAKTARPIKIGVIGSGRIGSTYGTIWSMAGHQVMFSDIDPAAAKAAAARSPGARSGTSQEAAAFGDVVLLAVPSSAMPAIGRDLGPALKGKVVIDTGNPQVSRDGEAVRPAAERGSGLYIAGFLPGVKLVRAFNVLSVANVAGESSRPGAKVGIPIGGDDPQAVALVARLVRDAGLDPVEVPGGLAGTKRFDLGPPLQGKAVTAPEVKALLGL